MVLLPDTRQQVAAGAFSEFQYDDNTAAMCVFVSVQCVGVGLCVCAFQIRYDNKCEFQ